MQPSRGMGEANGRKAKLASSYQQLLDEFSSKDLKSVGNYTLGRLIGKGSFGKVYLASHKLTNGSKVVLKSANKDDSNLAREIHHHRQFVHPHIARLYEVIVTESLVWLVLEYCPGDELYNHLLEHGQLAVPKVQKIFTQLVGAVSYVHQQSCVHRDLKLENILLDRNENVKLVDFGFTREYEGRSNHLQTFCGTICYSAPEMLKGEKYAGEKVDVWSLGIILYALLCGELPFDDDDDNVTRTRIISEEPKYPDHLPPDAVSLLKLLLSKRPFPRPSLPDILLHPFLTEHAPAQQLILTKGKTPPFGTAIETECLQRMRSAGVDIDAVIESVVAQKVDALAGWWTLLLEKEKRKQKRREKKRRERESESKSLRRLSAASSRLERMGPMLQDVDEDGGLTSHFINTSGSRSRGRSERRSAHYYGDLGIPDLPQVSEVGTGPTTPDEPPTPVDKDSIRSASTSRHRRPIPPPKEGVIRSARSRGSTLHLVTTSEALGHGTGSSISSQGNGSQPKTRKKPSQAIIAHWKNWTHWIFENTTRRRKGHERRTSRSVPDLRNKDGSGQGKDVGAVSPRPQTSKYPTTGSPSQTPTAALPKGVVANGHAGKAPLATSKSGGYLSLAPLSPIAPPRITSNNYKRQSLSPTPMTPRSSVRRSSAGLRGRKSTSSSLSSVRSIHHHHQHSHSKASSTSSTGSVGSKTPMHRGQSPHHSVKVLPATPNRGDNSFPSSIRLVRAAPAPLNLWNEGMPGGGGGGRTLGPALGSPNPFGSGVQFAKRKKNLFKGPSLNFGVPSSSRSDGGRSHSRNTSASGLGRRSGEMPIQEEDEYENAMEEEEEEEEIEEVEEFAPVIGGRGVRVESVVFEDGEVTPTKDDRVARIGNGTGASAGEKLDIPSEKHGSGKTDSTSSIHTADTVIATKPQDKSDDTTQASPAAAKDKTEAPQAEAKEQKAESNNPLSEANSAAIRESAAAIEARS